jgi:hypothetical protein
MAVKLYQIEYTMCISGIKLDVVVGKWKPSDLHGSSAILGLHNEVIRTVLLMIEAYEHV